MQVKKVLTLEHREKLSRAKIGKKMHPNALKALISSNLGEGNVNWVGDDVSYRAIHSWVERRLGKASMCSNDVTHKAKRFVWANISGEYKRDLSDWHSICQSCNKLDGVKVPNRLKKRVEAYAYA